MDTTLLLLSGASTAILFLITYLLVRKDLKANRSDEDDNSLWN